MEKLKALRYIEPGKVSFIEEDRVKPGINQLGIDILSSSMCNTSEIRSFHGGYKTGYGVSYPMKTGEPGHEAVGVVSELGSGTKGFSPGDFVAMTGHGGEPCHRSYVNRNFNNIAKIIPGKRDVKEAAILEMYGCAYHCALNAISEKDYIGKKVLVIGMGSMGLCTVQILNNLNTAKITAVDVSPYGLSIAKESGADKTAYPEEMNSGDEFDIVIECSGSVPGQEAAFALAPRILIFSSYNTREITIRQNLLFDSNTTIYNPGILTSESFIKAADLYNRELIRPDLLISKRISPTKNEYLKTIEEIKNGKIVKAIIEWN